MMHGGRFTVDRTMFHVQVMFHSGRHNYSPHTFEGGDVMHGGRFTVDRTMFHVQVMFHSGRHIRRILLRAVM